MLLLLTLPFSVYTMHSVNFCRVIGWASGLPWVTQVLRMCPATWPMAFFWIFQDSNRRTDVILCPCETFSPSTLGFFLSSASPALQPYQCFFFISRWDISSAGFSGEDWRFRMDVTWLRAKQLIGGFRPDISSQTKYFLHTWRLAPVPPLSAQIPINKISNFNILVCW